MAILFSVGALFRNIFLNKTSWCVWQVQTARLCLVSCSLVTTICVVVKDTNQPEMSHHCRNIHHIPHVAWDPHTEGRKSTENCAWKRDFNNCPLQDLPWLFWCAVISGHPFILNLFIFCPWAVSRYIAYFFLSIYLELEFH